MSIAEAAVHAPSADNHHAFELELSPQRVRLFARPALATMPYHRRVLTLVSFGAVVENMTTRAAALGYRAAVQWSSGMAASPIAEISLSPGEATSLRDSAIASRCTNRTVVMSGPRLSDEALAAIARTVQDISGVSLDFVDSGERLSALLSLVSIAEAERFNTRALHEDLFGAIRFDAGWRSSVAEGLPPAALAVEPGMRFAFAQLRCWPLMNALRRVGAHRMLALRAAYVPCRMAPHRAILTTSLPVEDAAIRVGMALERIWLELERQGLAVQPFAASALLALPGYTDVPRSTGERLRSGWARLTNETPMMVFRFGHARRPAVRAGRRPAADYVRN